MRPIQGLILLALPAAFSTAALAQGAKPAGNEIVVDGRQQKDKDGKVVPMSGWRVAETDNLIVYAEAGNAKLVPLAHNLQKLHFLLSMLFNRIGEDDPTLKLKVTLFGGEIAFDDLGLRNTRWQMGPYPWNIPTGRYYDPREDGAVMATPKADQNVVVKAGFDISNLLIVSEVDGANVMEGFDTNKVAAKPGEIVFPLSLEGRLYAAYAQHYLQTYFPAAYPRWYLDGFGEIFSTMTASETESGEGVIEYGRPPEDLANALDKLGYFPISKLIDGRYLASDGNQNWSPYHAWVIAHKLFMSPEYKQPLHDYLAAVDRGASIAEQSAALGDLKQLQQEIRRYHKGKVAAERMTYPAGRIPEPIVRQLNRSEAAFVKGKLELNARLELPPAPAPGLDPKSAAKLADERADAVRERDSWLRSLRTTATQYPEDLDLQVLLAEAECRSGNNSACIAAADRVLAAAPERSDALVWKGTGMAQAAIAGPANKRRDALRAARAVIVRANRNDPEAIAPLLAYYRSFSAAGEVANEAAATGLIKANEAVPSAPVTRLLLGSEYARRGNGIAARRTLRPVALGAYDSPERAPAKALMDSIKE